MRFPSDRPPTLAPGITAALLLLPLLAAASFAPARPGESRGERTAAHPAGEKASRSAPAAAPGSGAPPQTAPSVSGIRAGAARIEQIGPHQYLLTGDVDIRHQNMRLQADEVEYDDATHQCHARGHVVLEEGASRLTGDEVDLNFETKRATIRNAYGEMDPGLIVEAKSLEKIGDDRYKISRARLTSCTQPTPYWSLWVGHGTIDLGSYARLTNVALQVDHVPILYIPYLLWPAREDRASGLLMPQYGYSLRRGAVLNTAWFWAPTRNFDSTLYLDYYEMDGLGTGLETRWLPDEKGHFRFAGYNIDERIEDPITGQRAGKRYRFHLDGSQPFAAGWKLITDLNQVSDFNYYLNFERDLRLATSSSTPSVLELTRAWSYYTLNLRGERREQLLFGDQTLVQRRQPEIELRGRSRQLGRSPFYFAFETSAAALERETSYGRFDAFPQLRAPFRPAPWIEITPSVGVRETVYTSQKDPSGIDPAIDRTLRRGLLVSGLDILGPRFSRVFETPGWKFSPRVKNVLEPKLTYTYIPEARGVGPGAASTVLVFDEIDTIADNIHTVTYSLASRWFALRPTGLPQPQLALPRHVPLPGLAPEAQTPVEAPSTEPPRASAPPEAAPAGAPATAPEEGAPSSPAAAGATPQEGGSAVPQSGPAVPQSGPAAPQSGPAAPAAPLSPVEFATFMLAQTYGFNAPQSVLGSEKSDFSAVTATLRVNPTARHSLNLTSIYDVLRHTVERTTVSADLHTGDHLVSLTWFLSNDVGNNQSQLRLFTGTALFRRKLTLALETKIDLSAGDVQDQRYRIGYNTQCCGFLVEYLSRDFSTSQEREYRFLVNLKGVGTLLDLQQGVR